METKITRGWAPMTPERRAVFLAALRSSGGNFTAAAAAATPYSTAAPKSKPGFTSFRALMERSPEFSAAVAEVLTAVRDDVFSLIWRLAMEGTKDNVYQKGEQVFNRDGSVAQVQKFDTKLLLRLAAKLDPAWNESRNIQHSVIHDGATEQITSADLRLLTAGQKANLRDILATIRVSHGEQLAPRAKTAEQKALTHQPGEQLEQIAIEDAEYVELDEAEMAFPR